ncbi:MAG: hypothetical protein AMXMBFR58_01750 [Phycisphaerae bacterium]
MRRTPNIDQFRDFRPQDCPFKHPWCMASRNVYELAGLAAEPKLYGSERMVDRLGREVPQWQLGDWDWDVLLLMQDAAPHDHIAARIGKHPDPFSARNFIEEPRAGGAPTNRNLLELTSHLGCRKLAGSAFAGILKPGADYSGPVDGLLRCPHIRAYCLEVLRCVLNEDGTTTSRTICCLGGPAFELVSELLNISAMEQERLGRERGSIARVGRFNVAYLWHPSRWPDPRYWPPGGRVVAEAGWRRMADEAGLHWLA